MHAVAEHSICILLRHLLNRTSAYAKTLRDLTFAHITHTVYANNTSLPRHSTNTTVRVPILIYEIGIIAL